MLDELQHRELVDQNSSKLYCQIWFLPCFSTFQGSVGFKGAGGGRGQLGVKVILRK